MLVLKNADVFDGVNDKISKNVTIVIDGDKIVDILQNCQSNFDSAKVVDMKGRFITPGFIDCHLHLLSDEIPDKERQLNDQSAGGVVFENFDSFVAYRGADKARMTLYAGFTTAVDGGGTNFIDVALKDAIKMGYIEGPDYYICGKQITAWPSHFRGMSIEAHGPWGMRAAVRNMIFWGVDQIKLEMCAPLRTLGRSMGKTAFTIEETMAAVDEAHSANMLVSVHARSSKSIKDSILSGVDLITHGTGIDDECIELMLKKGLYLLPTLASPPHEPTEILVKAKNSRVVQLLREQGEIHWDGIQKAYKAGVKMVLSTDAGGVGVMHGENAQEMLRLKQIGMSNVECLKAATSEAAKAMKLENIGRIKKGYRADMCVLQENPLEALESVLNVKMVLQAGHIVKNEI
jgi:imidazolonepropionase-like amidohydrolase